MNEYSIEYLNGIASNEIQKRIIQLISENKTKEEMLDILIKEIEAENHD